MATLIVIRNARIWAQNNASIYKILSCGVANKKTPSKTTPPEPVKPSPTVKSTSVAKPTTAAKPTAVAKPPTTAAKPTTTTATPAAKSTQAAEDTTKYHATEYFGFNSYSFYDLDMTITPSRLKPPSKYASLKPKA